MRFAVLLLVGLGLAVISGACGGPGASDDACTSQGYTCTKSCAGETFNEYPCSASGPGFVCCRPGK